MIRHIGVIGSGTMGAGIAQVAAGGQFDVTLVDVDIERPRQAIQRIRGALERQVDKGKLTSGEASALVARITPSATTSDLAAADLVIEAVFEDLATKLAVIAEVCQLTGEGTIYATNTSSISITRLAAAHTRPELVAGMHFFNPVPVLPLVEIVRGESSADSTIEVIRQVAGQMGKTPVDVADVPGFAVNRLLIPMINEAVICLETGVADRDALDATMKLGAGHPMGPLQLADLIGLDVVLSIMEVLHRDFGEDKYRPAVLLRRMVAAGKLGRKSGKGFYDYV
jgi:3-hydroxybutyryl-CoA dehydrogenase